MIYTIERGHFSGINIIGKIKKISISLRKRKKIRQTGTRDFVNLNRSHFDSIDIFGKIQKNSGKNSTKFANARNFVNLNRENKEKEMFVFKYISLIF